MKMYLSELETQHFGFKIGRLNSNVDEMDIRQLESGILENKIDICRIKLLGSNDKVFELLNDLSLPYDIYNINYYNSLDFNNMVSEIDLVGFDVREVVDANTDEEFQRVLVDVVSNKNWMEYDSFLFKMFMPRQEMKTLDIAYYSQFTCKNDPSRYTGVLCKDKEAIGLFMGYFKGDVFFGNLFGVVKAHRQKGYAKYFYHFMYKICKNRGVHFFENEVNVFNFESQKSALSQNFVPKQMYFNITIYPLNNDCCENFTQIKLEKYDLPSLVSYLEREWSNCTLRKIHIKNYSSSFSEVDNALIASFTQNQEGVFIVAHFKKGAINTQSIYLEYKTI